MGKPEVAYKETISRSSRAEGVFSGEAKGRRYYGRVVMEFEPLSTGTGFLFESRSYGAAIPKEYLPSIYEDSRVDRTLEVTQEAAEQTTLALAAKEGIFCGISSGGAVAAALELSATVEQAVIVVIICDRGDRYLSTGVFPD